METLADINDGVAAFPAVGDKIIDTEWSDLAECGVVIEVDYPLYIVKWENDGLISTERVRY